MILKLYKQFENIVNNEYGDIIENAEIIYSHAGRARKLRLELIDSTYKNGKIISKLDSCDVVINGNQVAVFDSGGVGTIITISATATDECGNTTTEDFVVNVLRPANGGVGNGVDADTPGHDNNGGNDDPGFEPGNPGAKGGKKNR